MSVYLKCVRKTITVGVASMTLGWSVVHDDQGAFGFNAGRIWFRVW